MRVSAKGVMKKTNRAVIFSQHFGKPLVTMKTKGQRSKKKKKAVKKKRKEKIPTAAEMKKILNEMFEKWKRSK